ncbi:hypothetical protein [Amycolatopsis kentuckyensis]|uniref:hypothetical protein n=1 Tax=Amycolatopsis kentuckyensis TaxID=218823 RepID=UPI000A3917DB|nr:hypothetical protein [Amycolatopsis kentuckyensis]
MKTYLGIADIARHFGVTVSTVASWRNRHPDFPEPDAMIAYTPGWEKERLADIEQWESSRPGMAWRAGKKEDR